jgi:hypothetical protein
MPLPARSRPGMNVRHTVTFFALGARVMLDTSAGHGLVPGELIAIGRKFLEVRLDSGRVVRRIWPSWITRELTT